jgi:hypothetical protein
VEVLRAKGFDAGAIHRISQLVSGGQTAISINGEVGPFFRNKRGVRQGDPLSPFLFNFMAEALSLILTKAAGAGHIQGVVPHLIPGGITHLQYADDTLILVQYNEQQIANLKFLLMCFEDMSGLKINYHKSEVIVMGQPEDIQHRVADMLNCNLGTFPFTYLGLPMETTKPTIHDLAPLVSKCERRLNACSRFLTQAGRLLYVNSVLSALPTFYMCSMKLQKTIIKTLDRGRRHCIWAKKDSDKVQSLAAWELVCKPKNKGGLGIINLELQNKALLLTQLYKLYNKAKGWI